MKLFNNFNFDRLKNSLTKTRDNILTKINETLSGKVKIDEVTLEQLEETLISSDIGASVSEAIIEKARKLLVNEKDRSVDNIKELIKNELLSILRMGLQQKDKEEFSFSNKPYVILIIGINGSGKTTSIGKLAHNFKKSGNNVIIASADTFRAAANDQLQIWADRVGVPIVKVNTKDPSAVVYEALSIAKKDNYDVVLIDTAGRLHTQKNLMVELNKIKNVIKKFDDGAPNETLLVLDGNSGQNALQQVKEFEKYTDITGLIITKLDGTTKGGVVFQIVTDKKIPVKYIGVGENVEDLQDFEPSQYVEAIFNT
ncbi:MAG: signal recognition particle-docking protein FtsY [Ignavibacteriales bacterium]|nr:signal recognition particle-docking protein FtsY [Ignavibacteriales bacterium]